MSPSSYIAPGLKYKDIIKPDEFLIYRTIISIVAREMGINTSKIIEKGRKRPYVTARQICMLMIREFVPTASTLKIGQFFGGRDHTTVIHSCQTIRDLIETDEMMKALYVKLQGILTKSLYK